jgi:hypothetical protein
MINITYFSISILWFRYTAFRILHWYTKYVGLEKSQILEESGCFFHGKMIAPVLLISIWLLPTGKAKHGVGFWESGCCMRQAVKCRVIAAARPGRR